MKRADGAKRAVVAAGMASIAAAGLCACADLDAVNHLQTLGVDPASPVASDVERAQHLQGPIPSFADIPPRPAEVRPAAAYKAAVVAEVQQRRDLEQWALAHPRQVSDSEAFAAEQRGRLAKETSVSPAQQSEADAFARKLRDAAGASSKSPN